jgi:hypothetical protein
MPDHEAGLRVDRDGDEWVLQRTTEEGTVTSIRLSAENVLGLIEHAPFLQGLVASRLPGAAGVNRAVFAMPILDMKVGADALDEILLEITLQNGLHLTYAVPGEKAQEVADLILDRLAQLRGEIPTKQ